jgi:hypothetical protein
LYNIPFDFPAGGLTIGHCFLFVGGAWNYDYWTNNPINGGPVTGRRVDIDGYGILFTPDGTTDSIPGDGNPPDIRGMGSFGGVGFITSLMTPPISGPPSTSRIPIDCWNISKDATGGEIYIAANDGGVIKKLQLQLDGTGANLVTSVFGRIGDVVAEPADYSTVNFSVNLGVSAGLLETGNNYNVALGNNAALSMTTGGYSANIGYGSGAVITTGLTNNFPATGLAIGHCFLYAGATWTYVGFGNCPITNGNMVTGRRVDIDAFGMLYTVDGTTNEVPGDGNPPDIRGMGSFNSITGPVQVSPLKSFARLAIFQALLPSLLTAGM